MPMPVHVGRLTPAPPDVPPYLHKILELHLMHLVSLSQRHNAASVQGPSRSLELEHEIRCAVTLQVMRWFGQVDDADERWEMDVQKVVGEVGLFCVSTSLISSVLFWPHSLFDPNFVSGTYYPCRMTQYRRKS